MTNDVQITLWGWHINLVKTDEGIVVDVWLEDDVTGEPVATTYAFDSEKDEVEA